ncbi:MAG: HAD hydrolase-like protein, partial [Candidatus Accumulibacter sp.]|nr:HAD hydrolase-like protein [Accumulibacter sp.]
MARRFELLIFDWDGTLADSAGHIAASLQAACRDLGWPEPTEAQARYVIGIELRQALRLVVPGLPEDAIPP